MNFFKHMALFLLTAIYLSANAEVSNQELLKTSQQILNIYEPIFKNLDQKLILNLNTADSSVNATAQRLKNKFIVTITGGLINNKFITNDSLILVACHEIGFALGGRPLRNDFSYVGQADYFATSNCFKKFYSENENAEYIKTHSIPKIVIEKCDQAFTEKTETELCQRTIMASIEASNMIAGLNKINISIETPTSEIASQTLQTHPTPQCRLDNFIAGALCNSKTMETENGNCIGNNLGSRPACWYNANSIEKNEF